MLRNIPSLTYVCHSDASDTPVSPYQPLRQAVKLARQLLEEEDDEDEETGEGEVNPNQGQGTSSSATPAAENGVTSQTDDTV